MLRTMTTAAVLAFAASGCMPAEGPRAIQHDHDSREAWVYVPPQGAERGGIYRCYDNAGKPQCVKVELTTALTPSPGFCTNHPQ